MKSAYLLPLALTALCGCLSPQASHSGRLARQHLPPMPAQMWSTAAYPDLPTLDGVPYLDGDVTILARVEPDGSVSDTEMIAGQSAFEEIAREYVRGLKFRPSRSLPGPWFISVTGRFSISEGYPKIGFAPTGKEQIPMRPVRLRPTPIAVGR